MIEGFSFRPRARTVDHLGRGQIADSPTAVSELWKNAYDAYATRVSLQVFSGPSVSAAVYDDGIGMNLRDLTERWLVLGTDSKLGEAEISEVPPGFEPRIRHGEKGIGRLSVAFLSPVTILVSKKANERFAAIAVDWRLFENPYAELYDIILPTIELDELTDLPAELDSIVGTLLSNLGGETDGPNDRQQRLKLAWERCAEQALKHRLPDPSVAIQDFWTSLPDITSQLLNWTDANPTMGHGTAIVMLELHHELAALCYSNDPDEEAREVRDRLRETLTAFTDPYLSRPVNFEYEVRVHPPQGSYTFLSASDRFGMDELLSLEHSVVGSFDRNGVFRGQVVAFGKPRGSIEYVPPRLPSGSSSTIGAFQFSIGTCEFDLKNSSHSEEQFHYVKDLAQKFGGLMVYRDGLRVMPYGRTDSDWLNLEEERSKHAGRAFWAHRRVFGRVAFTRFENPNLRDKAGREGLVANKASREVRLLLQGFLKEMSRRWFGTASDIRVAELPEIQKRQLRAQQAAVKARNHLSKNVKKFVRENRVVLAAESQRAVVVSAKINEAATSRNGDLAQAAAADLQSLVKAKDCLRPPAPGEQLGEFTEDYRAYRDQYRAFSLKLEQLASNLNQLESVILDLPPIEKVRRKFSSNQSLLVALLDRQLKQSDALLDQLRHQWHERTADYRKAYYAACEALLKETSPEASLVSRLNELDVHYQQLRDQYSGEFESHLASLQQLVDGIELEAAFEATETERARLQRKVQDLHHVSQLGITIEIIGHELETLDAEARRNLRKLPPEVKETSAYRMAFEAHSALTERLRFLAPMKIAGHRLRQRISGDQIADYLQDFFERIFESNRIQFDATSSFRSLEITDLPSRIFPAFINLVNNSVYWLTRSIDRRILLDRREKQVILADSGPGVDQDDIDRLFELFFTRRREGRGLGLYLSKMNLAVGGHTIRYLTQPEEKVLPGANFAIEFRGVE